MRQQPQNRDKPISDEDVPTKETVLKAKIRTTLTMIMITGKTLQKHTMPHQNANTKGTKNNKRDKILIPSVIH